MVRAVCQIESLIFTPGTPSTVYLATATPKRYRNTKAIIILRQILSSTSKCCFQLSARLPRFQWLWKTSFTWRPSWTAASTRSSTGSTTSPRGGSHATPAQTPLGPWSTSPAGNNKCKCLHYEWPTKTKFFLSIRRNNRMSDRCSSRGVESPTNLTLTSNPRSPASPVVTTAMWTLSYCQLYPWRPMGPAWTSMQPFWTSMEPFWTSMELFWNFFETLLKSSQSLNSTSYRDSHVNCFLQTHIWCTGCFLWLVSP